MNDHERKTTMSIDDEIVGRMKALTLADARNRVQPILEEKATTIWEQCCEYEGRKPTDPYVRISPDNPHRGRLDEVIRTAAEMNVRISVRS